MASNGHMEEEILRVQPQGGLIGKLTPREGAGYGHSHSAATVMGAQAHRLNL
jgi:hypothetical protein